MLNLKIKKEGIFMEGKVIIIDSIGHLDSLLEKGVLYPQQKQIIISSGPLTTFSKCENSHMKCNYDNYLLSEDNIKKESKCPPKGRTQKQHNLIMSMNKKQR